MGQSLDAVDGVLLLIDATKGVQAQTLANLELASEKAKTIIPVINKCDLETANVDSCLGQLMDVLSDSIDPVLTSAKSGDGVEEVLDAIVRHVPAASDFGSPAKPLQARIFDSFYCPYRGIVLLVRVQNGTIAPGDPVRPIPADEKKTFLVDQVGFLAPHEVSSSLLQAGDVGYLTASSTFV